MKVRIPKSGSGMNDLQKLAKQAQEAQKEMEKVSMQLEEKEYTASSGGEVVKVTISGKPEIKEINIQPEVINSGDAEMISDLIITATNEAIRKANQEKEELLGNISQQMNIPGLF